MLMALCEEPAGDMTLSESTVLDTGLRWLSYGEASPVGLENARPGHIGVIRSSVVLREDFRVGSTSQAGLDFAARPPGGWTLTRGLSLFAALPERDPSSPSSRQSTARAKFRARMSWSWT